MLGVECFDKAFVGHMAFLGSRLVYVHFGNSLGSESQNSYDRVEFSLPELTLATL